MRIFATFFGSERNLSLRRTSRPTTPDVIAIAGSAVAIQVIGADVQQQPDVEGDRVSDLELVGGHLQDIDAVLAQGLELECRNAQIAADRNGAPGLLQDVSDQGRGRRFAVCSGDAHEAHAALRAGQ